MAKPIGKPAQRFTKPPAAKSNTGLHPLTGRKPDHVGKPLPVGIGQAIEINDIKHLPPEYRPILERLNWKPGEPIPAELPQILADEREAAAVAAVYEREAVDRIPDVPEQPFEITDTSFDSLSDEKQQEIIDTLQRDQAHRAKLKNEQALQALQQAKERRAQQSEQAQLNPKLRSVLQNTQHVELEDDREQAADEEQPADTEVPSAGLTEVPKHCNRCGFPVGEIDLVKITEEDKLLWLQSLVSEMPFRHRFSYYGGKLRITLRMLSVADQDAILAQINRDCEQKRYPLTDRYEFSNRYTVAMSLAAIEVNGEEYSSPTSLALWEAQLESGENLVFNIYDSVYGGDLLKSPSLARMVNQSLRDFIALTHKLESLAYAEDF